MRKIFILFLFIGFIYSGISSANAQKKKFKVVLDAGHGGKDPGNVGVKGMGYREKIVALKITLQVGKLLEKYKNIEVLYTRKTDVFMGLKERGKFAHNAGGDIFVSIHCDGFDNQSANGAGTFVLAPRGNGANLRVAQKENSFISYEENYKEKYKPFDTGSPASNIAATMMQEEHLEESLLLASFIQERMVKYANRKDRLVKQDNFQVLRETFMPSVLVEAGFLTNKKEGAYLNSKKGQTQISKAIFDGIMAYKKQYDANYIVEPPKPVVKKKPVTKKKPRIVKGVDFKVQIASTSRRVSTEAKNFKGLKGVHRIKIGSHHKYYFGKTSDYNKAVELKEKAKKKGFGSSFIVAFKNGKKVSVRSVLKP